MRPDRWRCPDTHPGLTEAVGVRVVVRVVLLLRLLELVPQLLYPVVVTGTHLTAGREKTGCFESR